MAEAGSRTPRPEVGSLNYHPTRVDETRATCRSSASGYKGVTWLCVIMILELELIQPHMAQKPVLRGEVGCACVAREVSVERGGMGERGCARRLGGWVWV